MPSFNHSTKNASGKEELRIDIPRDSGTKSLWQQEIEPLQNDSKKLFNSDEFYDVLIVGGGITGVTSALLLQQAGKKCILAEAQTLGFGTTGGTTSHLNTFFDTSYDIIEKDFGKENAFLVAESGKEAISLIASLADQYQIDCDFEYAKGFLFAETDDEVKQLIPLFEASQRAGVSVQETSSIPVPLDFKKALVFDGQARIHPTKYIYALASEFVKLGGMILDNTYIDKIEEHQNNLIAHSDQFTIWAKHVIYATHIPPGINILDLRCAPYRSYVLGVQLANDDYPKDFAYDMKDPYHYFRTHELNGQKYLIIGGEDHKTGHDDPDQAFKTLEEYTRLHYKVKSIDFKWSAQYYVPSDGLPYIGKLPGGPDEVYTATGYNGNGIILGTIAGKIFVDLLTGKKNKYAELFSPSRIKPVAGFADFVKENADVAYHFIADRFSIEKINPFKDLKSESGAIIKYHNDNLAVYKDKSGEIHALNPVCTHAKCIVNWNNSEKSWDCPCHGGRFDIDGKVLTGPPRKNLQIINIEIEK